MEKYVEKSFDTFFGHRDLLLVYLSLATLAGNCNQIGIVIDEFANCLEMDTAELRQMIVWLEKMNHIKIVSIKTKENATTFRIDLNIDRTDN